jgi:hypothetical protein
LPFFLILTPRSLAHYASSYRLPTKSIAAK